MKEVSDNDKMRFNSYDCVIDADLTNWSENILVRENSYVIILIRKVTADVINNMDLDRMPGFRLTWRYNKGIEPDDAYTKLAITKQFVRYNLLKRGR